MATDTPYQRKLVNAVNRHSDGFRRFGVATKVGLTFGLPAPATCAGACGTICGSCYAKKGNYVYPSVRQGLAKRLAWTKRLGFASEFAQTLAAITTDMREREDKRTLKLRINDTGDIYSPEYGWALYRGLAEAGARSPLLLLVWIPTRTWWMESHLPVLRALNGLGGVVVRPSALNFDDPAPVVEGLAAGAAVSTGVGTCPAVENGIPCEVAGCATCWLRSRREVTFRRH